MSERVAKTAASIQPGLTLVLNELGQLYHELVSVTAPDVSYDAGMEVLFNALGTVRALADRGAAVQAVTLRYKASLEGYKRSLDAIVQDHADTWAVDKANRNDERWSWEQQAAWVRTHMLDDLIVQANLDAQFTDGFALCLAIETMYRQRNRWRQDLTAQVDVLRFGQRLGEV